MQLSSDQAPAISAVEPDWSREAKRMFEWAPSRSLIASIRRYQRCVGRRTPWHFVGKRIAVLQHRFWSVVTGADIPLTCQIGGGLIMPHPNGIVIHPETRIGPNCLLLQQVTLAGGPTLGGHVDVGAGAKILGAIAIGDHAVVGANAVVTQSVAPNTTVVGIPARPIGS
jgi:serine O-acetyltransferase